MSREKRKRGLPKVVKEPSLATRQATAKLVWISLGSGYHRHFYTESPVPYLPPEWGQYVHIEVLDGPLYSPKYNAQGQRYFIPSKRKVNINPRFLVYWEEVEIDILEQPQEEAQ